MLPPCAYVGARGTKRTLSAVLDRWRASGSIDVDAMWAATKALCARTARPSPAQIALHTPSCATFCHFICGVGVEHVFENDMR